MRPVSTKRSRLRYPLDLVLGSEAQVRLLRVLASEVDTPLGVPVAARLAGITPAGARRALERLIGAGVLRKIGQGRTPQYGLREQEPVVLALRQLFTKERERYESFVSSLRNALTDLREVRQAWMKEIPAGAEGLVQVIVVSEVGAIQWMREELRSRLGGVEKEFDLIIEVELFTGADAPLPGPDSVLLLTMGTGDIPETRHRPLTHDEVEKRSQLLARGIAELMRSDPSLVTRAKNHLNRLLRDDQGSAAGDVAEWWQLLETYSNQRIRDILVSQSSRANRLRQSSPFFAVLTSHERDQLLTLMEEHQ